MIPHQQMVVSGGFPTEKRGFFSGKSEGQKRVSGGILRAEGGFPGIPHQQKVVGVLGDSPPAEDGFQGLPANRREFSGGFPTGRWFPGDFQAVEGGVWGIARGQKGVSPRES